MKVFFCLSTDARYFRSVLYFVSLAVPKKNFVFKLALLVVFYKFVVNFIT